LMMMTTNTNQNIYSFDILGTFKEVIGKDWDMQTIFLYRLVLKN
jgi:hypothetical protein